MSPNAAWPPPAKAALDFNDEIFQKVRAQFEKETEQLRRYKATEEGLTSTIPLLEPWEVGYWAEKQRKAITPSTRKPSAPTSQSTVSSGYV